MLIDQLVSKNLHPTLKVVFWLKNCFAWIVFRQLPVAVPIEVAAVTIGILIGQLKESLAAHHAMTDAIDHCDFRLRVSHIRSCPQTRFCTRQRLKEIGPVRALVGNGE